MSGSGIIGLLHYTNDINDRLLFEKRSEAGRYLGRGIAGFPQNTQSFPQHFDIDAGMIPQIIESFPHIVGSSAGSIFLLDEIDLFSYFGLTYSENRQFIRSEIYK